MRRAGLVIAGLTLATLTFATAQRVSAPSEHFSIRVIDDQTGRGVPLVELRAVNEASWWTDSNGIVALDEPGLMDVDVYLHVRSPGYEIPADALGNRGVKLRPQRGGSAVFSLKRLNIAERLYRITGQGIYRDSVLVGHPVPLKHPVLNGQVMGQDTVIATPYRARIYWFWGDTNRPSYPLGSFGVSGAKSEWPGRGGLDPGTGVDLTYFVDASGFSKAMCPKPDNGMRWIEGLMTVPDERGVERLVARLANMRNLDYAYDWHLVAFNDEKEIFESIQRWDIHDTHESAHPFRARVDGIDFYYLFPNFRVKADLQSLRDLRNYEAFTCASGDGRWRGPETQVERDASGRVRYAWKPGADRLRADRMKAWIAAGKLEAHESWMRRIDYETGAQLTRGLESVAWNEFRRRWIAFFADRPGEVWFAESDTPLGPWGYGRRVATHGDQNFYNIAHHPFFDQEGGRRVYFEGTYTDSFSEARSRTPWYNYNQMMYRLDLEDARLRLPVAVYRTRDAAGVTRLALRDQVAAQDAWARVQEVPFFALPPQYQAEGTVPVFETEASGSTRLSLAPPARDARPLFVALPAVPSHQAHRPDGTWHCRAITDGGDEFAFDLDLTTRGEDVRAKSPNLKADGSGALRDGHLSMRLKTDDGVYDCEATFEESRLSGTWRQRGGEEKGTWSGAWIDPTPVEWRSPAVVGLYRCRTEVSGEAFFSTEAALPAGCRTEGPALCRVWKPASVVLALEGKAQPRRQPR